MADKVFIPKKFSEMVEEAQEKHCERGRGVRRLLEFEKD